MKKIMKIKNNINLLYLYLFFSGLYFDRALWVLYLGERGMNMSQVGVLEAILHLSIVFFEIPTGMLADLYGRKISLIVGQAVSLLYALFMYLSGGFFLFTLAFAFLGFAGTFKSGAEQAILYDSLKENGHEKRYTRILGNQAAIILISLSSAKWLGGFIAETDWSLVYLGIFGAQLIGLFPLLMLREPFSEEKQSKKILKINKYLSPISQWREQFQKSLKVFKNERSLRVQSSLYIMIVSVIILVIFYAQEDFSRQGYSTSEIGLIFMLESLLGVIAAKLAFRLEYYFPTQVIFQVIFSIFVIVLMLFAYLSNLLAVLSLFVLGMLVELFEPLFSNFVQEKIESEFRATVFSMISLINSLVVVILFPLFGLLVDHIGFELAYLLLTIPMLSLIVLVYYNKGRLN